MGVMPRLGWLCEIILEKMVDGLFKEFKSLSVLHGELYAVRLGCVMARDLDLHNVEIESD